MSADQRPITGPFTDLALLPRYTPDAQPFDSFYVPLLSRAKCYDRAVGYWSAAELMYAAQGLAHFLTVTTQLLLGV